MKRKLKGNFKRNVKGRLKRKTIEMVTRVVVQSVANRFMVLAGQHALTTNNDEHN